MHTLQPKHIKLKEKEISEMLDKFNVSKAQLPKILLSDPALPENCEIGDLIRIERTEKDSDLNKEEKREYFRVVV
ncbi:MAG: DNA-directed RNA polymerase subunit H [Nanoarchaeota archaeon]|nr:DNA-directed RNA polymerase subunit H [Nanoarchaeota archaeon]MBU1501398.1 DNA-directed RNA polymerase subunit H [Nanoarchaeota archaeon]MBU2459061.1 DNA-directed RNA polymerase subunit H [Nanoarchaeota archaeon]